MGTDVSDEPPPLPPPSVPPHPVPKPAVVRRSSSHGSAKKWPQRGDRLAAAEEGGPNPFVLEHAKWVRRQRRASSVGKEKDPPQGGHKTSRPSSASRAVPQPNAGLRARWREQSVLQALEKLDDRDTLEGGVRQLMEVLGQLAVEDQELTWFLRLVYDERKPLRTIKGRREQLLLLAGITRRFGLAVITSGVLQDKILPFIFGSLRASDTLDAASRTVEEVVETLVNDGDSEAFLRVFPLVAKALLDPLILGSGWDMVVKERCVTLLISFTKVMLRRASGITSSDVEDFLESFATLLVQCLAVNHTLHEGLLQCLVKLAAEPRSSQGLAPHASKLTEICRAHLVDTPSATPQYVPEPSAPSDDRIRSESPKRGTLTRELALVCCLFLECLAKDVAVFVPPEQALHQHVPDVLAALARDNLNLQRLTRANERLRQGVTHAWQAWKNLGDGTFVQRPAAVISDMDRSFRRDRACSRGAQLRNLSQGVLEDPLADVRSGPRQRSPGPAVSHPSRPSSGGRLARQGIQLGSGDVPSKGENKASVTKERVAQLRHIAATRLAEAALGGDLPELSPKQADLLADDIAPRLEPCRSCGYNMPLDAAFCKQCGETRLSSNACEMTPCTSCGHLLKSDMAFCDKCGGARLQTKVLSEACKTCRRSIDRGAAFCHHCGSSQSQDVAFEPCKCCGHKLAPDVAFCSRCGNSRANEAICHSCGENLPVDAQYCGKCGALRDDDIEEELRGTVKASPLLFADQLDAEEDLAAVATLQPPSRALFLDHAEISDDLEDRPLPWETSVSEAFECAPEREPISSRTCELQNNNGIRRRPATSGLPLRAPEAVAGNPGVAVRHLRAEASQTEPTRIARKTQTESKGSSGPLPRVPPQRVQLSEEEALGRSPQIIDWCLPRDEDAPYFSAALRFIKADQLGKAFQCVFRYGNEKTLVAVLNRLQAVPSWKRLPEPDARYLAHLLAKLVCKDPLAAPSLSACTWLEGLLKVSGGRQLLAAEDLPDLQASLFSLSGAAGDGGVLASSIYYRLFQVSGG